MTGVPRDEDEFEDAKNRPPCDELGISHLLHPNHGGRTMCISGNGGVCNCSHFKYVCDVYALLARELLTGQPMSGLSDWRKAFRVIELLVLT